ncbi:MAG: nuclear transport factor 2 family protein [Anaerolineae bacterium]|nr:nuclear transport factor 2 family protein [Anaerolineae bacterium]
MKMARIESAARVVLEFAEAFNRHDVAGMVRLLTDDCLLATAGPAPEGATYAGKAAVAEFWQDFFRRSPQARLKIEDIFGFGLRCVMRWRCDWVSASGEPGHVRGVDIFQVRERLICEHRSYVKGPFAGA